ncbi:MAG: prepilin-type N-terminal cleavage/methylation domain-containing protein [Sulfurimonas sp.]|uniref:prepilin-type N-terminal cleavage/methylation domain-containing protein n=1 Tax=Sulfurimonas sp. TaxID=2022749 RepID=UPI0039E425D7
MVRISKHNKKFGFTLIELIFAIVIIAISVISLPFITQITSKGIENSLVQEAIFASSAELIGVTGGYWDGNSMFDSNLSSLSRVIDIDGDCNATTRLRPGHISQPYHRRCLDENATLVGPADNTVIAGVSAINDMIQLDTNLTTDQVTEASGYKDTYTSAIAVNRSSNIKTITSTIKDAGKTVTVLRTQSANIGEIDYFKRTF